MNDTLLTRLLLPPKGVKIGFGGDEKVLLFMYQSTNIHRMIYGIIIYLIFFFFFWLRYFYFYL